MSVDFDDYRRLVRLPLPLRRLALAADLARARFAGGAPGDEVSATLQTRLRLPRREADRLAHSFLLRDRIGWFEWLALLERTPKGLTRDVERVAIRGEDHLRRLAAEGRPIVLAPLHMGFYALGFLAILHRHFRGRRMLILRSREEYEVQTRALGRLAEMDMDVRFLNVADKSAYLDAVRFARAGAITVCFVDLPAAYGSPVAVELFGRPATIALGVDALARVAGATVVPTSAGSTVFGDTLSVAEPFVVDDAGPEARRRIADRIARHIETAVAASPADWHMWPRIAEFDRQDDAPREVEG